MHVHIYCWSTVIKNVLAKQIYLIQVIYSFKECYV